MIRRLAATALLCALAADGCGRERPLRLLEVVPDPGAGRLRLNEPIRLVFDRVVEPISIHADSVLVLLQGDARARGSLRVEGAEVVFEPRLPSRPDLRDGGYGDGGRVRLRVPGFPSRTGPLAADDGAPLAAGLEREFDVVVPDPSLAAADLFVDPRPGRGPGLRGPLLSGDDRLARDRDLELEFDEPIDPRSLAWGAVELLFDNPDRTPVATVARLDQGLAGAVLRIRPRGGFAPGTGYRVEIHAEALRDLGGHPLEAGGLELTRRFSIAEGEER